MNIGILDNFDSFTWNLKEEFFNCENILILRNSLSADEVGERVLQLKKPKLLVLSPGPGRPEDAGCMIDLIKKVSGEIPIFGVCLGLQAIVSAFGGVVGKASEIVHGKARFINHNETSIFKGITNPMAVGRYHSLSAHKVPEEFEIIAKSKDDIMAISHKKKPIIGVQFHPESILSTEGSMMIKNVLNWALKY